ncbi:hypothetical protein MNEG_5438 [Monoraphidium neglectum]|uniref:Rhamnogalacturonase A/B/Epimerase-like pectate lyase domain-containing protein n=1 Tax=Monoraphidium neglectum TaxID=145388 RepID=A0A0D2L6E5_9CHLO|nr:hypothetical protein MNEG_5438 [Monoraphidium neglectum]KIZ02519.1 hypothetical protein MNEG_5438 [Monoraphidium neglectum]|eukprot:XP_013901538.1 hypothetical protein MNEG_5438 [Monoraphidium neglectum]
MPPDDTRSRLERMQAAFGCDPAAAEALAQEHPVLLLLGPYALRRLASPSLEQGFSAGPFAKAGGVATSRLLSEVAVDAPCTLQMRAMHWGMRLHIKELVDHCRSLGLSVDTGKDFAIVWLGPRMQPRVVRRPPSLHQQQQQQQQQQPGASRAHGAGAHQRRDRRERRRRDARAPFLLVAYRHGAVALLGPPASEPGEEYAMPDEDAAALSRVMPLGAFYRTGRPDGLLHPGPSLAQPAAADAHTIQIDPSAPQSARMDPNKLVLRVLDMGHLRVASSILGQSVALSQVDGEVDGALTALHAAMADASVNRGTGMFAGAQDSRLFKAAAYGSMAITEAHSLLDAGELSWRYDAFSEAWELLFEDYCLETRFEALELKLDEFKQTATFDLKHRHGRRYAKLTDRVIWLLVISCAITLLELLLPPKADDNGGGGGGHRRGGPALGPADREWHWDEERDERRRWWQLPGLPGRRGREAASEGAEGAAEAAAAAAAATPLARAAGGGGRVEADEGKLLQEEDLLIDEGRGAQDDGGGGRQQGQAGASSLYGCTGERFNRANSRLMDWSYAGYMYGDYDPPKNPIMADIKATFGAKGDGVTDDTAAFELAFNTIPRQGTLLLPKGTYVITRRLDIDKQIFFRGEGAGQTVIYFPKSLTEVYGNTWPNGISQYAFGPGYINWNGGDFPNNDTRLAYVTANIIRGSDIVQLDSIAGLQPGRMVRIVLDNVNNDMLYSFNQRLMAPFDAYTNRADVVKFTSRIAAVMDNPPRIKFERALPFNVSTAWKPELHDWNTPTSGVKRNITGMSDLTIRFPADAPYAGESKEAGYNGLYMFHTAHSWITNVVFENADLGIILDGCSFNTVQNVTFTSARPTNPLNPYYGGKGVWLKGAFDCLVRDFRFATRFRYEIVTSYFAVGNV